MDKYVEQMSRPLMCSLSEEHIMESLPEIKDHLLIQVPFLGKTSASSFPASLRVLGNTFFFRGGIISTRGHFQSFARREGSWLMYCDLKKEPLPIGERTKLAISHVLYTK